MKRHGYNAHIAMEKGLPTRKTPSTREASSNISVWNVTDQEGGGKMNMKEIHEHVHGMVNTDVVRVGLTLVPSIYSHHPDKEMVIQMQMHVSIMGLDRDLKYFDFSLKSGPVIWDDDYEIKELLKHMVIYMTRKMGIMIIQGKNEL